MDKQKVPLSPDASSGILLSTVNDPLYTETEVEEQTNSVLKAVNLRNWRSSGKYKEQLPFVKIGSRVFYRKSVIERALTEGVRA